MAKLGAIEGVGIKKARRIKSAADHYLQEEGRCPPPAPATEQRAPT
jgi:hypothetical protein